MLQIGVDCEEISRFRRLPFGRNERFYKRIFTLHEIEYCKSFRDPYPRFAARFAAKEATIKALNNIAKPFYSDIEIKKGKNEQPKVYISRNRFNKGKQFSILLSLAHSDAHAMAFVVISDRKSAIKQTKQALEQKISHIKK